MFTKPTVRRFSVALLTTGFWLAVWGIASRLVSQELLLPSPIAVLKVLLNQVCTAAFWSAVVLSLLRIVIGYGAALVIGTGLAVCSKRFSLIGTVVSPLIHVIRSAPVASFIILTLVWIRTDWVPAFIAFLMVLPIVWTNVCTGLREISPQLREVALVYHLGVGRTIRRLYIPSVLPHFITACVNGLGFAWKSGVAAEVICRPLHSIGRELQGAKLALDTPSVFAWTVTVILLSLLLEKSLLMLARRFQAHQKTEETMHET